MIQMERFFTRLFDLKKDVLCKLSTVNVQKYSPPMTIVSKDFAVCTDKSHLWQWRKMGREIICVNVLTVLFVVWFVLVTKDSLIILTNNYNKTTMIGVEKEPDVLNGTYNLRVDPLLKGHGHTLRGRGSDEGAVRRAKRSQRMFLNEKTPYNRGLKSFIGKVTVDKLLGIDKNSAAEKPNSSTLEMSFHITESSGFPTMKYPVRIDPPFCPTLKTGNDSFTDVEPMRNWFSIKPFPASRETGNRTNGGGHWSGDEDFYADYKSGMDVGGPLFYHPSSWKRAIKNNAVQELEELATFTLNELCNAPFIFDIKPKDAEESIFLYE